jgi:prepilin-type N-terminal cleavage/methylation domain-containing protein
MCDTTLTATAVRERGLLDRAGMKASRPRPRLFARARSAQGFSLIEMLVVVAMIGILAAIGIGVSSDMVRSAKGRSGAQQLASFLKRHRELAISRRRNIEIRITLPATIESFQRAVPDPAVVPTPPATRLETMVLEGGVQFRRFPTVAPANTPDAFVIGGGALNFAGADPVLFTSEGSFTDPNGDPINATLFLGVPNQVNTANALTIIGTTATVRLWRYNGLAGWVQ